MLKRDIAYEDFNGEPQVITCYFNLTKTEIVDMEAGYPEDMSSDLMKLVKIKDKRQMFDIFKDLVLTAYGEKTPDGQSFMKTPEIRKNFEFSAAFDALFIDIMSDENAAAEFFVGILPREAQENIGSPEALLKAVKEDAGVLTTKDISAVAEAAAVEVQESTNPPA